MQALESGKPGFKIQPYQLRASTNLSEPQLPYLKNGDNNA